MLFIWIISFYFPGVPAVISGISNQSLWNVDSVIWTMIFRHTILTNEQSHSFLLSPFSEERKEILFIHYNPGTGERRKLNKIINYKLDYFVFVVVLHVVEKYQVSKIE